jgi:hypothetical protein
LIRPRTFFEPRLTQDLSRVPLDRRGHSHNGAEDDEVEESVNLARPFVSGPLVQAQAAPFCPAGTRVDHVTDLTQAGLKAGFLSAYGIAARMRVVPDSITWDGKQITEALTQTSSTCPAGLTHPGPCSGMSTFTVGAASGGSALIPRQPPMRNRFYDFHTSRSHSVSFLHDPTRNPTGMNSCETVCRQEYSCNGKVIGAHQITRQFRKDMFNGQKVTIVDVTKVDLPQLGDFPIRILPPGQEYASRASEPGGLV